MSDGLETVWEAEPHTLAKHGILKSYLDAWTAILSRAAGVPSKELLFVDGFAGPGEYKAGEPGSPVIALNAVLNHTQDLRKPVRFRFIEKDKERYLHLCSRLSKDAARIAASARVKLDPPVHGECDSEIRRLIDCRRLEQQPLGPALFFLDQFGYSQVPMSLLREIMQHQHCEAFSYLNCQRMNHFLSDQTKWTGITEAYGDESWKAALDLTGEARQDCLINTYKEAIKRNAGVNIHVWSFAMFDRQEHLINWLIFSTRHLRGLEEMKKAMWKADSAGDYRFSDRVNTSAQQSFFSTLGDDWLADELTRKLSGRKMSEDELFEFILTQTPFYRFKNAVNTLRKVGKALPAKMGGFPVTFV